MPTQEEKIDFTKRINKLIEFALEMSYHPAMPTHFTDTTEYHTDRTTVVFVYHGHTRQATVDTRIAPLIGEIWRAGFHTAASCQGYTDGLAYIQFPGMCWGGETLVNLINKCGGTPTIEPSGKLEQGFNFVLNGENFGGLKFKTATIRFSSDLIEPLIAELKAMNGGRNSPTFELVTARST